jgi:8-oxo-dGTP diphosphatase
MRFTYPSPRPALTVDCVVLGFDPTEADRPLRVLLIRRCDEPFAESWAIPGGFVAVSDDGDQGESIDDAARRELEEETGVVIAHLEQLYTFGAPRRDPRGRVVSVAFLALVRPRDYAVVAGSDAAHAAWVSVEDVRNGSLGPLAFDHDQIVELALERLATKIRYAPIGFSLLPPKFTLGDLHKLYEALTSRTIDVSNFHKKVGKALVETGVVVRTGAFQKGRHRPAPLYAFEKRAYDKAVKGGFNFDI